MLELFPITLNASLSQELLILRTYKFQEANNLQFSAHTRNWPATVVTASFPHLLVLAQIILWGIIHTTFQTPKLPQCLKSSSSELTTDHHLCEHAQAERLLFILQLIIQFIDNIIQL